MLELYDYSDWIEWPREDVAEYAREIASHFSLAENEARFLADRMLEQAGYWPSVPKPRLGPVTMTEEMVKLCREMGDSDEDIFNKKCILNQPLKAFSDRNKPIREMETKVVGEGLTERTFSISRWIDPYWRKDRRKERKRSSRNPFRETEYRVRKICNLACWRSNSYPLGRDHWITTEKHDEPYSGLLWYVAQIWKRHENAKKQAELGNTSGAMWHAFRLGELCQELEIRLAHGDTFLKAQATHRAQSDAAKARKRIPDELRRETYWRYRNAGNNRFDAGTLAAQDLGLSEPSIRNAFPGGRYPPE